MPTRLNPLWKVIIPLHRRSSTSKRNTLACARTSCSGHMSESFHLSSERSRHSPGLRVRVCFSNVSPNPLSDPRRVDRDTESSFAYSCTLRAASRSGTFNHRRPGAEGQCADERSEKRCPEIYTRHHGCRTINFLRKSRSFAIRPRVRGGGLEARRGFWKREIGRW